MIYSVHSQKGMMTLIMSIIFLLLVTTVSLIVAKNISGENKVSNNEFKSKVAFEAAEAGLAQAFIYLSKDPDIDGDGVIDNVFDSDDDGIGDSSSEQIGNQSVTVSVQDLSDGNMTTLEVSSQGFSVDRTVTKTITQIFSNVNPLPNPPDNPMTTRGNIIIKGSASVHNPEGNSTIWSGGDIDLGSNNSTSTEVANPADPNYPSCMDTSMSCSLVASSNKTTVGLDIIEYDSSLASLSSDEIFENFFGMPPITFKDSMVTIETTPIAVNTDADLSKYEVIWVEGDTELNSITIGCSTSITGSNICSDANRKPSIIIINGDLKTSGTLQIYGVAFVMGSMDISGNTTIYGALMTANNVDSSTGGSMDIWYNSEILSDITRAGVLGSSSGTWRDF